jgi:dTDP-4-amino-4,6-dideoxygalactose transaminase
LSSLALPLHAGIASAQVDEVVETLRAAIRSS